MRWIRDHARQGSWLALFALVLNLGLSFGHIHAIDAKRVDYWTGLRPATPSGVMPRSDWNRCTAD